MIGMQSPRTDERCFTYCSQSISGRAHGQNPFCRSLCIRRIFAHEVRHLLARTPDGRTTTYTPDADPAQIRATFERLGLEVTLEERKLNIPLPPEGQRPAAFFEGRPGIGSWRRDAPAPDRGPVGPMSAAQARKEAKHDDKEQEKEKAEAPEAPRVWEEGTYVWYTQSSWHTADHLSMMYQGLRPQAGWERYKERLRTEAPQLAAAREEALRRQDREMRDLEGSDEDGEVVQRFAERYAKELTEHLKRKRAETAAGRSAPPIDEYTSLVKPRQDEWVHRKAPVPTFPDL